MSNEIATALSFIDLNKKSSCDWIYVRLTLGVLQPVQPRDFRCVAAHETALPTPERVMRKSRNWGADFRLCKARLLVPDIEGGMHAGRRGARDESLGTSLVGHSGSKGCAVAARGVAIKAGRF